MRRREFITVVGGAAVSWPLAARAQQPAMPVVGFLGSDSPELYADRLRAFRRGLKEAGYIEAENVAIEYRWANGAAELVGLRVAVLVSSTTPSALALKAATTSIPIVFFIAGDPVALGLVASLNRPGGNITGTTALTLEAGKKWLQLLQERQAGLQLHPGRVADLRRFAATLRRRLYECPTTGVKGTRMVRRRCLCE